MARFGMMRRRRFGRFSRRRYGGGYRKKRLLSGRHKFTKWETKIVDVVTPGTAIGFNATGGFGALNLIKNGSSWYNRIGSRIGMTSLSIKLRLYQNAGTGVTTGDLIMFAIIYDKQPNGALPTLADVFSNYDLNGTGTSGMEMYPNPINRDRFVILLQKFGWFSDTRVPTNTGSANNFDAKNSKNGYWLKKNLKLNSLETTYGDTNGNIADIRTGSLIYICWGINAAGAAATVNGALGARLRFHD